MTAILQSIREIIVSVSYFGAFFYGMRTIGWFCFRNQSFEGSFLARLLMRFSPKDVREEFATNKGLDKNIIKCAICVVICMFLD